MSNTCRCPTPPGGRVSCRSDQLAVCGYRDGQFISGCFDRPDQIAFIPKDVRRLAIANWVLTVLTGASREAHQSIDQEQINMLEAGQYSTPDSLLRFSLPRDLQFASDVEPLESMD